MTNTETITMNATTKTINIPVRVEMTSIDDAPFEFTANIDDVGQIILTPNTKDVEFISAETPSTVQDAELVFSQATETHVENDSSSMTYKTMVTTINISATMLVENENTDVSAVVDEIGQVVLYPLAEENSFVSAAINDSLNLVTEDMSNDDVTYCVGYTIDETDDKWIVTSDYNEEIKSEFDSLDDAKIFICETEISRIKELSEDVYRTEVEDDKGTEEPKTIDKPTPEVTAEVIEESISVDKPIYYSADEVDLAVKEITKDYTEESGTIKCDSMSEANICQKLLKSNYKTVIVDVEDNYILINYSGKNAITEDLDNVDRMNIIDRFIKGDLDAFEAEGTPAPTYIHLTELDSDYHEYYYDEETDTISVYKRAE